jgi:ubiquinone/menaquinone biosynthesis C-methylase UbiE
MHKKNEKSFKWTTDDWIRKLKQQAKDSREYRYKLYDKVGLNKKQNILDIGCGTGEITLDIASCTNGKVTGIDIDTEKLNKAKIILKHTPNVSFIKADAQELPFEDEAFDLVVFNIVLIYIKDQQRALLEMARVVKSGGIILASLEPDYASRIDYPESPIPDLFLENIQKIGADITTGRRLKYLFGKTGLETEVGIDTDTEFLLLKDDNKRLEKFLDDIWIFEKLLRSTGFSDSEIEEIKNHEIEKIKLGLKFSFTPCFYAIGKKV